MTRLGYLVPVLLNIDPMSLTVKTSVDGQIKQDYNTSDMFFNVYEIVSFLSHDMTLNPGDIIACGTNSGLGPMVSGETVTVSVSSIWSSCKQVGLIKITPSFPNVRRTLRTRLRYRIKIDIFSTVIY